jgi:hypothetical protein
MDHTLTLEFSDIHPSPQLHLVVTLETASSAGGAVPRPTLHAQRSGSAHLRARPAYGDERFLLTDAQCDDAPAARLFGPSGPAPPRSLP